MGLLIILTFSDPLYDLFLFQSLYYFPCLINDHLNRPSWPSGLECQFQIQVEVHSKNQVRIPFGDDYMVIITPTLQSGCWCDISHYNCPLDCDMTLPKWVSEKQVMMENKMVQIMTSFLPSTSRSLDCLLPEPGLIIQSLYQLPHTISH